jgi:hypothetical protein
MALSKFLVDVNNIQALSDRPNEIDGLTSSELKQRFDKAGADIKNYLNNTLTSEIDTTIDTISGEIPDLSNYVQTSDSRLTNARQCDNTFASWTTARENLKIGYGTTLPSSGDNGSIFLLYE